MLYTKVRMDFRYAEKGRFYRVILIKGNPDLHQLAHAFGDCLRYGFAHVMFIGGKKGTLANIAVFSESPDGPSYGLHTFFEDLDDYFTFEYDSFAGWDFDCKRYKKQVEYDSDKDFIVIEGAGQGIWEDSIRTLYAYFDGKIDGESDQEDEKKGIVKPWNVNVDKYSDFDKPLDLELLNQIVKGTFVEPNHPEPCKEEEEPEEEEGRCFTKDFYKSVKKHIGEKAYLSKAYDDLLLYYGKETAEDLMAVCFYKTGLMCSLMGRKLDGKRLKEEVKSTVEYVLPNRKK